MNDIEQALDKFGLEYEKIADRFYKITNPKEINITELIKPLDDAMVYCSSIRHYKDVERYTVYAGDVQYISDSLEMSDREIDELKDSLGIFALKSYGHTKKTLDGIDTIFERSRRYCEVV